MASTLEVQRRRAMIVQRARQLGHVRVNDLARCFEVNQETIRRDLQGLADSGLIERIHGGAVPMPLAPTELAPATDTEHPLTKVPHHQAIAQAALGLIDAAEVDMFIDAGRTTEAFARQLARSYTGQRWRVVTNSARVASTLVGAGLRDLTVLGGVMRGHAGAMSGEHAAAAMRRYRADFAFLGANALNAGGVATTCEAHAQVKREMLTRASTAVVLCSAAKIGASADVPFAQLSQIDALISNQPPPAKLNPLLTSTNTKVVTP